MYPGPVDFEKQIARGTTTIGVTCKDGVVLATDTRATMGYFIAHKHAKKVYPIADHLAMTIAGAVADAQAMVDILNVFNDNSAYMLYGIYGSKFGKTETIKDPRSFRIGFRVIY